jgi:cobalamin synthase
MLEWVGGILFFMLFAFFTPVMWIVLTITIIAYAIARKLWIASLVSMPVSAFFYLAFYMNDTGWFTGDTEGRLLMASGAAINSILLVWIGRSIARKIGTTPDQDNSHEG